MRNLFKVFTALIIFAFLTLISIAIFNAALIAPQVCDNFPAANAVYPVFMSAGPAIENNPKSGFYPSCSSTSSQINCAEVSDRIAIIVHSNAANSELRANQRRELDSHWLKQISAKMLFVVGISKNDEENEKVGKEISTFDDVLRADVDENYHNITYKAMLWVTELAKCSHPPKLVLKIDDDVLVDKRGVEFLLSRFSKVGLSCKSKASALQRILLLVGSFNEGQLFEIRAQNGTYCQGMAYILSGSLLHTMARNIHTTQFLWMDDWYVTRGLVASANPTLFSLERHILSTNSEVQLESEMRRIESRQSKRVIFAHFRPANSYSSDKKRHVWTLIQKANNRCR